MHVWTDSNWHERCRTGKSARRSLSRRKRTLHEQAISVAFDLNRTLRAPRRELWYPPSNAMGRFNEAAGPQMALAARAEPPRVLAGLHDSTKWPGIPHLLGAAR